MDRIGEIADRHRLTVIEDAAHAVGTRYRGTHAGGFGGIAVFSFHPLKNITTGEGGMITHNDEALESKLRVLRFHGISTVTPGKDTEKGETRSMTSRNRDTSTT